MLKISVKRATIRPARIDNEEAHRRETREAASHEKQEDDSGRKGEGR